MMLLFWLLVVFIVVIAVMLTGMAVARGVAKFPKTAWFFFASAVLFLFFVLTGGPHP